MNIMMFILGSGIMENPTLLWFAGFLSAAIIFGLLAWQIFERYENPNWTILACMMAVAAIIFFFRSIYHLSKMLPTDNKPYPRVEKMEFENHDYLIFREKFSFEVVHNPECACRQKFKTLKEK